MNGLYSGDWFEDVFYKLPTPEGLMEAGLGGWKFPLEVNVL